jgi:hypothetical protein
MLSVVLRQSRIRSTMPKETDPERLHLLARVLRDPASNVVMFSRRAHEGSAEADDLGLNRLLPESTPRGRELELQEALARCVEAGEQPNRIEYAYEDRDPETIYEFRITFRGERIYVKSELKELEAGDPTLVIRSVKRQN